MQKSPGRHDGSQKSAGPKKGDGDWLCPDGDCANWNFAWRTSCNRCSGPKPPSEDGGSSSNSKKNKMGHEIGKAMAEKSKGLFSADDWQCTKCGNVNWARRHQCNVCNAPRFGEVEERTGFGGGFNDRGVVEYKERKEDTDDEWDEFGRRKKKGHSSSKSEKKRSYSSDEEKSSNKKKRRDSTSSSSSASESDRKKSRKEDSEEEEEDDSDDGDLSKYDLSGWGDEEEDKK